MTAMQMLKMMWDTVKAATQLAVTGIVEIVKNYQEAKENQPGEVSVKQIQKSDKEKVVTDVPKEAIDIFKNKAKDLGVQFATMETGDKVKVIAKHDQMNLVQDALNDTRKELMAAAKDKGDLQAQFNIATETMYGQMKIIDELKKELAEVKKELALNKEELNLRKEMTITKDEKPSLDSLVKGATEKAANQKIEPRTANFELSMSR